MGRYPNERIERFDQQFAESEEERAKRFKGRRQHPTKGGHVMPYPDDTSNLGYLDRPCRPKDAYLRERYELLRAGAEELLDARVTFVIEVQRIMTKAYSRDVKKVGQVTQEFRDHLDDATGNTIGADVEEARDKMEGN